MLHLAIASAVLASLVLLGVLAVLGRVTDTRDPDWSLGRLLRAGLPDDPRVQ